MAEVVTDFVERRMDQLVMESIENAMNRIIDAGFESAYACELLDLMLVEAMGDDEEWTAVEAIHFYDSVHITEMDDDEVHIAVDLSSSANDNSLN